jgi:surfeit locus 1 family protein
LLPDRLRTLPWRRIRGPGIAAFIAFWVLLGLGYWQLQRLAWKEGSWIPGKAALYGDEVHDAPAGPIEGGELIMPFQRPNGEVILVDLGWVPQTSPTPIPEPTGSTQVSGYLHAPIPPGWFAGTDSPAQGLYYTLNPDKIGAGLGFGLVAPYTLIAMGPQPPPGSPAPQPRQKRPTPPNNHKAYARNRVGLAGLLIFQFFFFARERVLD